MSDQSPQSRLSHLFHRAAQLHGAERDVFVGEACGDDAELRRRLEALLRADEQSSDAGRPAPDLAAPIAEAISAGAHVAPDMAGVMVAGRYVLAGVIGAGGGGTVFRAQQVRPLNRTVAVKFHNPELAAPSLRARFAAESQVLADLRHPNIAQVFDAGETDDGRLFYVMEFIDGTPITTFCDHHRLSISERLRLFLQVCEGIQCAHVHGVIHRDIKPGNLLVAGRSAAEASVRVIDFGVARSSLAPGRPRCVTMPGAVMGTVGYMAPEQAERGAGAADVRSDVYALGLVLSELIAGRPARAGAAMRAGTPEPPGAEHAGQNGAVTPEWESTSAARGTSARRLRRTLRGELSWIPARAMALDPADRYQSAQDLADDIRAYLAGRELRAGVNRRGYRARKLLKRYRVPLSVAMIVLVVLTGSLVVVSRALAEAERAYRQVETGSWAILRLMRQGVMQARELSLAGRIEERARVLRDASGAVAEHRTAAMEGTAEFHELLALLEGELARLHGGPGVGSHGDSRQAIQHYESSMQHWESVIRALEERDGTLGSSGSGTADGRAHPVLVAMTELVGVRCQQMTLLLRLYGETGGDVGSDTGDRVSAERVLQGEAALQEVVRRFDAMGLSAIESRERERAKSEALFVLGRAALRVRATSATEPESRRTRGLELLRESLRLRVELLATDPENPQAKRALVPVLQQLAHEYPGSAEEQEYVRRARAIAVSLFDKDRQVQRSAVRSLEDVIDTTYMAVFLEADQGEPGDAARDLVNWVARMAIERVRAEPSNEKAVRSARLTADALALAADEFASSTISEQATTLFHEVRGTIIDLRMRFNGEQFAALHALAEHLEKRLSESD